MEAVPSKLEKRERRERFYGARQRITSQTLTKPRLNWPPPRDAVVGEAKPRLGHAQGGGRGKRSAGRVGGSGRHARSRDQTVEAFRIAK